MGCEWWYLMETWGYELVRSWIVQQTTSFLPSKILPWTMFTLLSRGFEASVTVLADFMGRIGQHKAIFFPSKWQKAQWKLMDPLASPYGSVRQWIWQCTVVSIINRNHDAHVNRALICSARDIKAYCWFTQKCLAFNGASKIAPNLPNWNLPHILFVLPSRVHLGPLKQF